MKKLRAADSADAIVDGLLRRRAAVYDPSSLRPLSVLSSRYHAASSASSGVRSAPTRSPTKFDPAARADYQQATRWPLPELVAKVLTNHETAERRVSRLATQTPTSAAASFSNSTHTGRAQLVVITHESGLVRPRPTGHGHTDALLPNRYKTKRPDERPPDARNGRDGRVRRSSPMAPAPSGEGAARHECFLLELAPTG